MSLDTRSLGYTGEQLTGVGLGTWAIGGGDWQYGWGPQEDRDSVAAIRRALDVGINWIDTARVYGLGHSEKIVGEAIAGLRDEVFLATKCGPHWKKDGAIYRSLKAGGVRKECESSLKRLKTDVIDLYQIHWPDPPGEIEEGWTEIAKMVEEGKIRYAGVSNFTVEHLRAVQAIHPVASLQPPYSMLRRGVEDALLPYCAENNIGVIVYSPMVCGLLTGKFSKARLAGLAANDWRRGNVEFRAPAFDANLALVDGLKPIAERNNLTLSQLAIAWVLRRPEVTSAIVGARRPDQIEETAQAGNAALSEDDVRAIEQLLTRRQETIAAAS